jgi:23S rRNA (cytosine1962-C5)-methyltransferase
MPGIIIRPRSRIYHGHDWVYATEVQKMWGTVADGSVVTLKDGKDRMLGSAIYNSQSQIVARRFSRQRLDLDAEFFKRRIAQAIEYRRHRGCDPRLARLVWSESDGIPGLIVDRYGDCLVVQTLTLAMDQRLEMIVAALVELCAPVAIVERNDAPIRKAEGMELRTGMLHGSEPAPFVIEAAGMQFEVDLLNGQKTGFYLDQLPNYVGVSRHAAGRRVLDCFANQGAFAIACAKAGATAVDAVEISADTCEQMRRNVARNDVKVGVVQENAFDFLKRAESEAAGATGRYDIVILDPPSFTKSKGTLGDAMRGYKDIHLRALRLLGTGGLLATYCCSHHVSRDIFMATINEAAVDARRTLRLIDTFSQGLDHPIITTLPETEYLKGFLFELAPGR